MDRLTTISLFSGCGGSDLGAARAGADIVFANDKNRDAIATYRKYKELLGAADAEIVCGDVSHINVFPKVDLLIGCYPCKTYTMGGPRSPESYDDSQLFKQFARGLKATSAKFFVAENVSGLMWLDKGRHLREQTEVFAGVGKGYNVSYKLLNARDYGVPAARRRVFIVGVRADLGLYYHFPEPSHGPEGSGLEPWASHGDAISSLPIHAKGEYHHYTKEPFSWWFLSRNRKRRWEEPSFAIQANQRHVTLHPAAPSMRMVKSDLQDGFKQWWEFTGEYDHLDGHPERPLLEEPRRLSWRECAAIQTFPLDFEPCGPVVSKYRQIGNAVPPLLMEVIVRGITEGMALRSHPLAA